MLEFNEDFGAHLRDEASMLCWCWQLTRSDDVVLGFTDHDQPLVINGVSFEPRTGFTPSELDHKLGFAIDNSAVEGLLSSEAIHSADIESGLYEHAQISFLRVNWNAPELYAEIWSGHLGRIVKSGDSFQADLVGQSAILARSTGRVFSRVCDARFGDERCGLEAGNYPEGTQCVRTFEACKGFSNSVNFRGFPFLIGDDAMQIGPDGYSLRDGSSRYS